MELSFVNLLLVLLAGWVGGQIAERLRYPAVLGELLVGITLGPPLLGLLQGSEAITVLAELGVLLMMLYVGMEIDPRELGKASWAGLLAAAGGFITPFVLGYLVVVWMGYSTTAALFLAIAVAITSLTTKSRILVDLKILDTRIAHVLMAGALISDSAALVVFAAVIGLVDVGSIEVLNLVLVAGKALLFFGGTAFLGLKVFPFLFKRIAKTSLNNRTFNATLVLLLAIFFAELAELAGLHAILGTFLAGLFLHEGMGIERKMSRELTSLVHDISIGFLAPIFFVTAGFDVTFSVFRTDLMLLLIIFAVAFVGKILGTALFYLPTGYGWREGITIGAGMNGRGAVEIIIAGIGLEMGIISNEIFSILVFMAIFTTATVPFGLKWGTDWLRRHGELVRSRDERKGFLIVGAGPIARFVARELSQSAPVRLLDLNRAHCQQAEEEGLEVMCADALEQGVLEEAGAVQIETLLALTPNAEVNMLTAQLARNTFLVPHTYVLLSKSHGEALDSLLTEIGAEALFAEPVEIGDWDRWIARGEVAKAEHDISEVIDRESFAKGLGEKSLPLLVARGGERFLLGAVRKLEPGDKVIALNHN